MLYPRASRATSIDPSWERIGVTGNHPIWSQDRHDYVAAMDLRLGERLKNLSGDTVWVQQKLPRPGPTPVYNLEVQDEHVYYVGASGVLAHNAGDKYKGGANGQTKLPWGDGLESHHMPAKAINGLHRDVGPAIQMSRSDHIRTSSHGSRADSAAYRSFIEDLLTEGEVRKAMAIEIRDVRRAAFDGSGDVSKYNDAIREMLAYARQIRFVPPKTKSKQR